MNSTNETHLSNCTLLTSRSDFAGYVQQINATTNFNVSLLEACQSNICNALWGNGNADISGIGMIVGYMFESALSLVLAVGFAVQKMPPLDFLPETFTQRKGIFKAALKKAHKKFFECAVFFTVSIQIACVVVLVRRDFGISANGLGGFTTQITWSIAVLSMLPLMYPLSALDTNKMIPNKNDRLFRAHSGWNRGWWGGTTIITDDEWTKLTTLCLTGMESLTSREEKILSAFGAAGSLTVTIYGLARLFWYIYSNLTTSTHTHAAIFRKKVSNLLTLPRQIYLILAWILLFLTLTIPQFWGVLRLRGIQRALADATSNAYVDNQWTFGQVVAVMIFAPVVTEVGYFLLVGKKESLQERGLRGDTPRVKRNDGEEAG